MAGFKRNTGSVTKTLGVGIYAKKVTTAETKEFLKKKLSTSESWALRGLERIYAFQTESEKVHQHTHEDNKVGFGGADAEILSSFAEFYAKRKFLTEKQMTILYKKIPKYWRQLSEISNKEVLESMIKDARKTS